MKLGGSIGNVLEGINFIEESEIKSRDLGFFGNKVRSIFFLCN